MRILYGITKSNFGGAQRYVFDLAKAGKEAGHDVSVLCGGRGLLVEKLEAEKIRVISTPTLDRDISLVKEWQAFQFILKTLLQEKPDVFHVNSSKMSGLGALAARIVNLYSKLTARSYKLKTIFTAHGWPFWEKRGRLSVALMRFFSWLTALFSHRVIAVSNFDLVTAQKMPFIRNKAVRIYNGVSLDTKFENGEKIRSAFPAGKKITGTIGELNANKNQIALIEQAHQNPEMYVAIIGEGENRAFLEKKIVEYGLSERIKLFGYLPMEEVLKGFDTFALPSLKEGLPYVLIEAKLAGLPIEANLVGGVSEILDQDISEFSLEKMVAKTFNLYN